MNGEPWTEEKTQMLMRLYPTATKEVLESEIGHSFHFIRCKAAKLKIRRPRPDKKTSKLDVVRQLRTLREQRGFTREILAARVGYSASQLSRWERGSGLPSLRQLTDWCMALGMKLSIEDAGA